ncbi:MAG: peptidylprolyl isomerase [Planctomycetota bacterium]|nr:peptidylprolyl isomerase [Planctomycetota bacterium]MDA1213401.1 peptidylprolyl isomerase [Planctomycetota bacterium]
MGVTFRRFPWVIVLGLIAGCETLGTAKVDNPVLGPAPPRVATREELKQNPYRISEVSRDREISTADVPLEKVDDRPGTETDFSLDNEWDPANSNVELASHETPAVKPENVIDLGHTYVVASVNGFPIFANDVLLPYTPVLNKAEAELSPEQLEQLREQIIKKELPRHVEKMILISALNEYLKPEQKESFEAYLDAEFENQLKKIRKELKVETKQDLDRILAEQKTSLATLKEDFRQQQMAMQYMSMKSQSPKSIGRQDLVNYYRSHMEDYAVPARVKWQVIIVPFKTSTEKKQARAKVQQAIEAIDQGMTFEQAAKRFSSGPSAEKGGHWGDWTTKGSLADEKLEQLLYEVPIGEISAPYQSKEDFRIVRVIERNEDGYRSFEDVQFEIEKMLNDQKLKEIRDKVIRELRQNAYIETIYDKPGQPYIKMLLPDSEE